MESQSEVNVEKRERKKRMSCSVWLILAGFAFFSFSGWLRMARALIDQSWLEEAGVPAVYLAVSGALWGIVALLAVVWIFLRLRGSALVAVGAALVLALSYWADRLLMGQPYGINLNIPFALGMTLLAFVFLWFTLRPMKEIRQFLKR